MLSLFQPGRGNYPFQLVHLELKQSYTFQLRNLRVPYFKPEDRLQASVAETDQSKAKVSIYLVLQMSQQPIAATC